MDFPGERRRDETHRSTTVSESRLAKKVRGKEARLCFGAHVLMDNREILVVDVHLTPADGTGERDAAISMLGAVPGIGRFTVRADGRQLVLPAATTVFAGRGGVNHPARRCRIDHRPTSRIDEAETNGRKDPGNGGGHGRDERTLGAEMTIAGYNLVQLAKLTAATT